VASIISGGDYVVAGVIRRRHHVTYTLLQAAAVDKTPRTSACPSTALNVGLQDAGNAADPKATPVQSLSHYVVHVA